MVVYVLTSRYLPDPDCHTKLAGIFKDKWKATEYGKEIMEDDEYLCFVNEWEVQE